MRNQGSKALRDAQQKINQTAVKMANEAARKIFLDDTVFAKVKQALKIILRRSWTPYQKDFGFDGFGMKLDIMHDPKVREIMIDPDLYEIAVDIAMAAITATMVEVHPKAFVETMLADLILEPDGSSYYAPFLVWPGEKT